MSGMTWGDALKIRTAEVGLRTQKELATVIGANLTTVQRWMASDKYPRMRTGFDVLLMHTLRLNSLGELKDLPSTIGRAPIEPTDQPRRLPIATLILEMVNRGVPERLVHEVIESINDAELERRSTQGDTESEARKHLNFVEPPVQHDGYTEQRISTWERTQEDDDGDADSKSDRDAG